MSKHTTGPWAYAEADAGREFFVFRADDEKRIPITNGGCGCCNSKEQSIELEEDARLIAAAPDLLEALESLLSSYESAMHSEFDFPGDQWTAEGRNDAGALAAIAAIAKARGES
jgi:hypothetical protein